MYESVKPEENWITHNEPHCAHLGGGEYWCRVIETNFPNSSARIYFLEHEYFYNRNGVYAGPDGDYKDNDQRFAFLCRAGLNLTYYLDWMPDVVHAHDWTTGLVPVYLNTVDAKAPLGRAASVMTIHNLQHQGYCDKHIVGWAGLPWETFRSDGLESMGAVNMMKGGLYHATKITTVSPTYAHEIQGPVGGCGLNHLLQFRAADLVGILNGIDMDSWDPSTDKHIPANFSVDSFEGKDICKAKLQKQLGIQVDPSIPVYGVVSRLYDQKGLDILANILPGILDSMRIQVAILGSGDPGLEERFKALAKSYPDRLGVYIGYNEDLSHLIYAGSDFFLMPSRFEPCGLSQMYSMRYGTPPIARATGGLVDTVDQYVERMGMGSGFLYEEATDHALYYAIGWACSTYYDRNKEYMDLRRNGMRKDFSWAGSAKRYEQLYEWAIDSRKAIFGDTPIAETVKPAKKKARQSKTPKPAKKSTAKKSATKKTSGKKSTDSKPGKAPVKKPATETAKGVTKGKEQLPSPNKNNSIAK